MTEPNRTQIDTRKPGRSFDDPTKPMGADIIERSPQASGAPEAGVYGRAASGPAQHDVAERAKAIAVLRKAEEFMASDNPGPQTRESRQRAIELAAGRVGLTLEEYRDLVRGDAELEDLERKVLESA